MLLTIYMCIWNNVFNLRLVFFSLIFWWVVDWNSSLSTINFIPYKYCVIVVANDSITDCDLCNVGTMTCSNCSRLSVLCILDYWHITLTITDHKQVKLENWSLFKCISQSNYNKSKKMSVSIPDSLLHVFTCIIKIYNIMQTCRFLQFNWKWGVQIVKRCLLIYGYL